MDFDDLPPQDDPFSEDFDENDLQADSFHDEDLGDDLETFEEERVVESGEKPALERLALSEVPLEISVELGRLNISLEALQNLQPGASLPFSIPAKIVHLTLSGRAVAEGEIIEVGDMIGVKIRKIYR